MMTSLHSQTPHTFKLDFAVEKTTAFGGLVLCERLASRLGLWKILSGELPRRRGNFQWSTDCLAVRAVRMLPNHYARTRLCWGC
jgi:hypothetical protein